MGFCDINHLITYLLDSRQTRDRRPTDMASHQPPITPPLPPLKEVVFRTPVILGSHGIPVAFEGQLVKYRKGALLHEDTVPAQCDSLPRGMVIDLPLTDIAAYYHKLLAWLPLQSDEELVQQLHLTYSGYQDTRPLEEVPLKELDLLAMPLFTTLDQESQQRIISGLVDLQHRERPSLDRLRAEFQLREPLDQLITKKHPLSKREQKALDKEKQMVYMKHVQGMKPAQIARKLKVSVYDVYRADRRLKGNYGKAIQAATRPEEHPLGYFYEHHVLVRDNLEVKQGVADYLSTQGMHNLKRQQLQQELAAHMPGVQPSTLNDIGAILKQDFKLRYIKYDGASVRYKDPQFDEKRLWACRILSQFLLDDALIISIDESHIRSDRSKQYQWQFLGSDRLVKAAMKRPLTEEGWLSDEDERHSWDEISSEISELSRSRYPMAPPKPFGPVRPRGRPRKFSQ